MKKMIQKMVKSCLCVGVLTLGLAMFSHANLVSATDKEHKTLYDKEGVVVTYHVNNDGPVVEVINHQTTPLKEIQLSSKTDAPIEFKNKLIKVDTIDTNMKQALQLRAIYPGATDENPNTSPISFRTLPRTGTLEFYLTIFGLVFLLGGISLAIICVKRQNKYAKSLSVMSLVLAGGLMSSVFFSGVNITKAEQVEYKTITIQINEPLAVNNRAYMYEATLSFNATKDPAIMTDKGVYREKTEVQTTETPFKTVVKYDESKDVINEDGSDNVMITTEGMIGKKEVHFTVSYLNDSPYKKKVLSEEVVQQPVDEVKTYGIKPVEHAEDVAFKTVYKADDKKLIDTEPTVEIEGKNGKIITTYTRNQSSNEVVQTKRVEDAINKVVAIPSKKITTSVIPFETTYQANNDENEGYEKVITEGQNGTKEDISLYDVNKQDGTLTKDPISTVEGDITGLVNAVIKRGTRYHVVDIVPYQTITKEDASKWDVEPEVVETEGQNGTVTKTYVGSLDSQSGQLMKDKEHDTVVSSATVDPISKVVVVGTKRPFWREETISEVVLPTDDIVYMPSEILPFKQMKLKSNKENGEETVIKQIAYDEMGEKVPLYEAKIVSKQVVKPATNTTYEIGNVNYVQSTVIENGIKKTVITKYVYQIDKMTGNIDYTVAPETEVITKEQWTTLYPAMVKSYEDQTLESSFTNLVNTDRKKDQLVDWKFLETNKDISVSEVDQHGYFTSTSNTGLWSGKLSGNGTIEDQLVTAFNEFKMDTKKQFPNVWESKDSGISFKVQVRTFESGTYLSVQVIDEAMTRFSNENMTEENHTNSVRSLRDTNETKPHVTTISEIIRTVLTSIFK